MVKKQYVYFNPFTETYFFNTSNEPKDERRVEIRNGERAQVLDIIGKYLNLKRKSKLYIGESVPEEVRNSLKRAYEGTKLEVEVKKGL